MFSPVIQQRILVFTSFFGKLLLVDFVMEVIFCYVYAIYNLLNSVKTFHFCYVLVGKHCLFNLFENYDSFFEKLKGFAKLENKPNPVNTEYDGLKVELRTSIQLDLKS